MNKPCRNCASTEHYTRDVHFTGDAQAALPVGFWLGTMCRLRVCGECGLAEWFLTPESLEKAKKKLERES
ncbi:MAG: hypothetical protein WCS43_02300 [Verrucomicrobiota bacterium]